MKCDYHPTQPVECYCPACDKHFCRACTDDVIDTRDNSLSCFLCNGAVQTQSKQSKIEPFWSRLNEIYKYGLNPQAVGAILVLALISALAKNGGLLALLPAISIYMYSFACLRETADGENAPPGIEASFEGSISPVFYVLTTMFVATSVAAFIFGKFGTGMGIIVSFILMGVMPAAIITIAVEERLLPALNIANLINIVKGTGIGYGVMVLFLIVMLSSMGILSSLLYSSFEGLSIFLTTAVGNYYSIIVFHILGYLVYQNHDNLGYQVSGNAGIEQAKIRTQQQRTKAKLELLIKAGQFESARTMAKNSLSESSNLWEWERTLKLMCIAEPSRDMPSFFKRYAEKLILAKETDKLADAFLQIKRVLPKFEIIDESQRIEVAQSLVDIGKPKQAISLIQTLPKTSKNKTLVNRSFNLLADAFDSIDKGEEHAKRFRILAQQHSQA